MMPLGVYGKGLMVRKCMEIVSAFFEFKMEDVFFSPTWTMFIVCKEGKSCHGLALFDSFSGGTSFFNHDHQRVFQKHPFAI